MIMTVGQVKEEVMILNLGNIKKFPCRRSRQEDFYILWQKFGPQAARDYMIPSIWNKEVPLPSDVFNG